ncbi:MAG TPA: hypothetical protein VJ746_00975 [Nitrospira sp.]|nr:hypothetical protein [Nitrospira sp.]
MKYHLTARPWQPIGVEHYLEVGEAIARWWAEQEDPQIPGRILNPFGPPSRPGYPHLATGMLPFSVAILYMAGRAKDLLDVAIRAMDYETAWYAERIARNDYPHGLLFSDHQVAAFDALKSIPAVPPSKLDVWRSHLAVPTEMLPHIFEVSGSPNSYCYRMLGEWNRYRIGLAYDHSTIVNAIETQWSDSHHRQRDLLRSTRWNLYRDVLTSPDSLSTEGVGRVQLLLLSHAGYDGPSGEEMRSAAERGTHTMLFLQNSLGEVPPNGRADNHLWVDALNAAAMELMAEQTAKRGKDVLAGQFRRAAMLALSPQNIGRFRRGDGSYFSTKNRFDPNLRVSYQGNSGLDSNADLMVQVAEAYQFRKTDIPEHPTPSEIGGYAITLDGSQAAAFANAGGMMMQVNTRGEVSNPFPKDGDYDNTTPLGVVRFARAGWDTRLGPGDGQQNRTRDEGISFAPTFVEEDRWIKLASVPARYQGTFSVQFAHPLLVRCTVIYNGGASDHTFRNEFILTPDGILSITTSSGGTWGMTVPLLTFDGAESLEASFGERIARTSFSSGNDEQTFIALNPSASLEDGGEAMRSPYGDLRPVRFRAPDEEKRIFIYPRNGNEPSAEAVRDSFLYVSPMEFSSVLGKVRGNLYVGRTAAGGVGDRIDLDEDGSPEAVFSSPCGFILQLQNGVITRAETDQDVTATIAGARYELSAYTPLKVSSSGETPADQGRTSEVAP